MTDRGSGPVHSCSDVLIISSISSQLWQRHLQLGCTGLSQLYGEPEAGTGIRVHAARQVLQLGQLIKCICHPVQGAKGTLRAIVQAACASPAHCTTLHSIA